MLYTAFRERRNNEIHLPNLRKLATSRHFGEKEHEEGTKASQV
jgi:hypothetical protein